MKDNLITKPHPAIILANDRPSCAFAGSEDTLMEWAIDAEDMLHKLVDQNQELLDALWQIATYYEDDSAGECAKKAYYKATGNTDDN